MKDRRKIKRQGTRPKTLVGVAWYSAAQWQQLREISADAELLEATYEEWLLAAEQTFKEMTASGAALIKVPIELQDLIQWCHEKKVPIDAEARARYVVEILSRGSSRATR